MDILRTLWGLFEEYIKEREVVRAHFKRVAECVSPEKFLVLIRKMRPKLIIVEKDKYLNYTGIILSIDKNHETYFLASNSPRIPPYIPPFLHWLLDEIEYNTDQGVEIILNPAQKLDEIEKQFDCVKIFEIGLPEQNEGRTYRKIIWAKAASEEQVEKEIYGKKLGVMGSDGCIAITEINLNRKHHRTFTMEEIVSLEELQDMIRNYKL